MPVRPVLNPTLLRGVASSDAEMPVMTCYNKPEVPGERVILSGTCYR